MFASLFALLPLIPAASALVIPRQDTSNTTESSQLIHPGSDTSLCLTVAAGYAAQGTSVGVAPCFGSGGSFSGLQNWVIERGETQVQLAGTNWCLDFGDEPNTDGTSAKIWDCYPGVTQQTFYYTDDDRIAIEGGTTCLDLTNGGGQYSYSKPYGVTDVQGWSCGTGNPNQVWSVSAGQ